MPNENILLETLALREARESSAIERRSWNRAGKDIFKIERENADAEGGAR